MTILRSFDGTEAYESGFARPDRYRHLFAALRRAPAIARGAGLSYCSASAGQGVLAVSSLLFNRILAFDGGAGIVEVESGITLGDLYAFLTPRGWMLPVMPGHPSITVGGCIGCNVHGKNQSREGNFINAVESLTLFHPDHGEVKCSHEVEPELFRLTIGGFGLTGFITSARLKLQKLTGASMRLDRIPVANLKEGVAVMEKESKAADLLYSWHDLNRASGDFGRGFVYAARISAEPRSEPSSASKFRSLSPQTRSCLPFSAYSRPATRLLLRAYGAAQGLKSGPETISLAEASFPPHGKEFYFRLFGRAGLREYQMLVPRARWDEAAGALAGLIRKHRLPMTLGSLKLFDGKPAFLDFDGNGVCLTVDVPARPEALRLFSDLDELVLSLGAAVNAAKDSRLDARTARRALPGYEDFKAALARYDPKRRFDSALRRRLDV